MYIKALRFNISEVQKLAFQNLCKKLEWEISSQLESELYDIDHEKEKKPTFAEFCF